VNFALAHSKFDEITPNFAYTHYLHVLYASQFFLGGESEQMYHNSVVNSVVNIYLISLLAQPLRFQIQTREFSLVAFSAHYREREHQRKVAQIIAL
jgi:hypothetical protein